MQKLDDLFFKYKNGDEVLEELLSEARNVSLKYARSKGYSDPEDIAQEVSLYLFQRLPSLAAEKDSSFSLYLYTHMLKRKIACKYLRNLLKGAVTVEFDDDSFEFDLPAEEVDIHFSSIPDSLKKAAAIMLAGYTQEETARALGIPLPTLRQRMQSSRKKFA